MIKAFKIAMTSIGFIVALFCLTLMIPPFSEAKLQQLRQGMTTNQVEGVLGCPSSKLNSTWYYNPRRPSFEVLILWFNGANQLENWTID